MKNRPGREEEEKKREERIQNKRRRKKIQEIEEKKISCTYTGKESRFLRKVFGNKIASLSYYVFD